MTTQRRLPLRRKAPAGKALPEDSSPAPKPTLTPYKVDWSQPKKHTSVFRPTAHKVTFVLIFIIPFLLLTAYELLYASDRYESVASAIITQESQSSSTLDLSLLGMTNAASSRDAYVMTEFMQSADMLKYLDARLHLREHFSSSKVDWWSRLPADASFEEFHDYFLKYVTCAYDSTQQVIRYSVQTFDPVLSQKVMQAILERSQEFIDRMNDKISHEQIAFLDTQISKSEKRLTEERNRLVSFQQKNNMLSTDTASQAILNTISALEGQLAQKQSDLNSRLAVLDPNAPQLTTIRLDIKALKDQIKRERDRLAGQQNGSLSELGSKLSEIQMSLDFVSNVYKANLNALEQARIQAAQRLKYLVVVASPSRPDSSQYPDRPYVLVTGAIILLVLFFVASLLIALVREHA